MKDLQQIKNEVFEHPMFTIHEDIDWVVDQIAIRYAQEQNKELVDMLELLDRIGGLGHDRHERIRNLIEKHKQS